MDAVANPECNSCYDKYEGSCGNRPHLLGCDVDTKRKRPDQKQQVLLQRVLHDATVDLRPEVFLMQRWINHLAEKAIVAKAAIVAPLADAAIAR
jgi:hypothetical protein